MNYPEVVRFPIELNVMLSAINNTKHIISEFYEKIADPLDITLKKPVFDDRDRMIEPLIRVEEYLKSRQNSSFFLINDSSEYFFVLNTVLSALKIYKRQMEAIEQNSSISCYQEQIGKINDTLEKFKENVNQNLFDEYYEAKTSNFKKTRLFISYQQNDVKIACKIQELILNDASLEVDAVFVAYRDIGLSEEWRSKILAQLDVSTHLLAICTDNYIGSPFGNQEVGYAIARGIKVVPIFWEGTNRNKFGLLESFQALSALANERNLERLIVEILDRFDIK